MNAFFCPMDHSNVASGSGAGVIYISAAARCLQAPIDLRQGMPPTTSTLSNQTQSHRCWFYAANACLNEGEHGWFSAG